MSNICPPGQCQVPLAELESKCEYHKSLVLFDGRRPLPEAKIEVAIRVSEPFSGCEMINENIEWCYIEHAQGQSAKVNPASAQTRNQAAKSNIQIRSLRIGRTKSISIFTLVYY